jgi:methyl-accepting chemotaxis protein
VVQQNAANAEESASASEEMTAQAEQMKDYVGELTALVGGKGEGSEKPSSAGIRRKISNRAVRPTPHKAATKNQTHSGKGNGKALPVAAGKGVEVRPEQVIPLSEEEFGDF